MDVLPDPLSHARAAADNPDLHIVCVLRDPVERAYSAYQWAIAKGVDQSPTFEAALADFGERSTDGRPTHGNYLVNGCYAHQLRALQARFPSRQMHVLFYEDVTKDASWLPKLLEDLNLDPVPLHELPRVNVHRRSRSRLFTKALAHRGATRSAVASALPVKLRFRLTSLLWAANTRAAVKMPIPAKSRRFLVDYYRLPDIELAELLGADLPWDDRWTRSNPEA